MKKYAILFIYVILLQGCYFQKSEISTKLWEKYFLGNVDKIEVPFHSNDNLIITSTKEGTISLMDLSSGKIEYRKIIEGKNIDISTNEKNILVMDKKEPNVINIFNSHTGQFMSNLENSIIPENQTLFTPQIKAVTLKKGKSFNVYLSQRKFQIFNNNQMLFDSKIQENTLYYDYYINEDKEKIYFVSKNEENQLFIQEIPTVNIYKNQPNITIKLDAKFTLNMKKAFITQNNIYIIRNDGKINIIEYLSEEEGNKEIKENEINFNFDDKSTILLLKDENVLVMQNEHNLNIISPNGKITTIESSNNQKCEISKEEKMLYCFESILNERQINVLRYNLPLSSNNPTSSFKFNVESTNELVKSAVINKNIITLATNRNIYQYDTSKFNRIIHLFKNTLTKITFSELITYSDENIKKESGNENNKINYTSLNDLKSKSPADIINNFFNSILQDLFEIGLRLKNLFFNIIESIKNIKNIDTKSTEEIKIISESVKFSYFIFSESKELYVFNGETGEIKFFKQFEDDIELIKINKYNNKISVIRDVNHLNVELIFYSNKTKSNKIYIYDLLNNELRENPNKNKYLYSDKIKEYQNYLITSKISFINLSKEFNKDRIDYPFEELTDKMTIEKIGNNNLYAFKIIKNNQNELILSIAYNLKFDDILFYTFPKVNENPNPTYLVGGKIYYKFINEDLIVVLSKIQTKSLLITIIKGDSGKILYETIISNIDIYSLSYAFQDNWGLISYIKKEKGFRRNEIFSIELMKQEIETSLINLLQKHFNIIKDNNKIQENTIGDDIKILSYTFALERHIKNLYVSDSEMNNANKFIAALLENNKIFLVDRRTFSPRRPKMKDVKGKLTFDPAINSIYADQELVPYEPITPFIHKFILDAELRIDQINKVDITSTESESTFMLCSIGIDIKCYKVYPDKVYDNYNKKFLSYLILIFSSVCVIVIYFLRNYTKKEEFKNIFSKI